MTKWNNVKYTHCVFWFVREEGRRSRHWIDFRSEKAALRFQRLCGRNTSIALISSLPWHKVTVVTTKPFIRESCVAACSP